MMPNVVHYYDYPGNFSNGSSVEGIGDLFLYMNYSLNGLFGWMLILSLGAIIFLTMKSFGAPFGKAITSTSFVCTLIAVTLMMMGLITFYYVMILAIITILFGFVARDEAKMGL